MKGPARHRMLIRSWNILVLLRARPHTLSEMAEIFEVNQRTIRRDMEALCEAQFPIITSRDDIEKPSVNAYWSLAPMPEWPRHEHAPVGRHPGRLEANVNRGGIGSAVPWNR